MNFKNYFNLAGNIAKILDQIAVKKETHALGDAMERAMREADGVFTSGAVVYDEARLAEIFHYDGVTE